MDAHSSLKISICRTDRMESTWDGKKCFPRAKHFPEGQYYSRVWSLKCLPWFYIPSNREKNHFVDFPSESTADSQACPWGVTHPMVRLSPQSSFGVECDWAGLAGRIIMFSWFLPPGVHAPCDSLPLECRWDLEKQWDFICDKVGLPANGKGSYRCNNTKREIIWGETDLSKWTPQKWIWAFSEEKNCLKWERSSYWPWSMLETVCGGSQVARTQGLYLWRVVSGQWLAGKQGLLYYSHKEPSPPITFMSLEMVSFLVKCPGRDTGPS